MAAAFFYKKNNMKIVNNIPTDLDTMFNHYLYRVDLNKKSMDPSVYRELKLSFTAAIMNMILIIQHADSHKLNSITQSLGVECLEFMESQI